MTRTNLKGKTVTLVPANDTISPDHRGKQGTVVKNGDAPFPFVLFAGHDEPVRVHRTHLVVTPTPGTIEINPAMLFGRLVDAAEATNNTRGPVTSTSNQQYRFGAYDALYAFYTEVTGLSDDDVNTAIAETLAERDAGRG